jgi:hypothetical protein
VLVHELVHHLQETSGRLPAYPAERERDACALQERWLRRFGGSLERDFGITPMLVLARPANCGRRGAPRDPAQDREAGAETPASAIPVPWGAAERFGRRFNNQQGDRHDQGSHNHRDRRHGLPLRSLRP